MLRRFSAFNLLWSVLPTAFGLFEDRQWLYFGEPDLIGQQNGTCENVVVLASKKFPLPFSPNLTSTCTSSGGPIRLIFGEDVWSGEPVSNISVRFDCDASFSLLRNYSLIHRDGDTMPGNTSASIACDLIDSLKTNTTHILTPPLHSNGPAELHPSAGQDSAVIAAPFQSGSAKGATQGLDSSNDGVPQLGSQSQVAGSTSGKDAMPTASESDSPQGAGLASGKDAMPTASKADSQQGDNTKADPALGGTSVNLPEGQQRPPSGTFSGADSAIPTLPGSPSGNADSDATTGAVPSRTDQPELSTTTNGTIGTNPDSVASLTQPGTEVFQNPSYGTTTSNPGNTLPTQDDTCTCRSG
jgi:hypothetical protein